MSSIVNILIVDDHPTMIEGYKSILNSANSSGWEFRIISASNCETAFNKIKTSVYPFEIVVLDMILPSFEKEKLYSGEDLAVLAQKEWPESKIIMSTSHTESFLLYHLIKKINPEGLLVKSDFTPEEFLNAIACILKGEKYYSTTAKQCVREVNLEENYMDAYNRRIISLLARGIKTKSLPHHLNISISAIDKRKAQIKDLLNIQKGNDEDIIREAKKRGFV